MSSAAAASARQHLAAVLPNKGSLLKVVQRSTPTPGPGELLIEVHSIALNPIDYYQRDMGFVIDSYPAIPGSDVAGIVVATGPLVPAEAPQVGTRVAAFAPCFFHRGAPDYGALQKKVLVPATSACPLPESMSFNEGAILPMAVQTTWAGWYSIGLARDTKFAPEDKKGVLVWGGGGSVGSAAIQVAKSMGFVVYATASAKHHEYLKTLGASKLFDYKETDVVEKIVQTAKEDGVAIDVGYTAAVGTVSSCMEVLKAAKSNEFAKLSSAVRLPANVPTMDDVEVKFVSAPLNETERDEFSKFVYWTWLKEKLQSGEFVPSPSIKVVDGGLESANKALDELKAGVSGVKLVLEV
jgi:NADPH:quinone reductase-like Zn-dependent oxidoreductase